MSKGRTTFILGAGASIPYEFPSGEELIEEILNVPINQNLIPMNYDSKEALRIVADITDKEYSEFFDVLRKSSTPSIDTFLSIHKNDNYRVLAKICIALIIKLKEKENSLYSKENNR